MPDRRTKEVAFAEEVRAHMARNLRVAATAGIIMVPSFGLLDWMVAPAEAGTFLGWRLGASAVLAGVVGATWTSAGRRHPIALGYIALWSAALPVSAMVAWLDPGVTPYYAGLSLAMLFNGLLFPWHPVHTLAVNLVLVASFFAPVLLAGGPSSVPAFTNNSAFLLATGAVSVLSSWVLYREQQRRFDLSWSLEVHAGELAEANDQLRRVDEAKSRFYANVSHELRTPLTLALTPVEAVLREPDLPEAAREMLDGLLVDLRVLSRRIDDLIDLARLDNGAMDQERRPVDVRKVAEEVVAAARAFAWRQQIELRLEMPERLRPVYGDLRMLEQIAFNLVSNALKFTPAGGGVVVRLVQEGDEVRLVVQDTGPGLDEAEQRELFTRFGRSTHTETARGSGLGLALVKEFAELHGGRVAVRSQRGGGAAFDVWLPLGPEMEAPRILARTAQLTEAFSSDMSDREVEELPEVEGPDDRPLVLVVDDNQRLRRLVRQVVGTTVRIAEARDGGEALAQMAADEPAVVVCDLRMAGVDGAAFLRAVRETRRWESLPVLMLTAHGDGADRDRLLEQGATDFLGKPFSPRELRAKVLHFVALRLAQTRLAEANDALARALADAHTAQIRAVRAEKLASIGQLAAGIAHEVKNPVNYILNFARPSESRLADLAEETTAAEARAELESIRDAIGCIVEGAERVESIVNGLQAFARGGETRAPVKLDREIETSLRMVLTTAPAGVNVHVELDCPGTVVGSPVAIGAVAVNLVSNAIRALPGRGNVWVRTHDLEGAAVIEVEDDGAGISREHLSRIWDAFFTTRPPGQGLGLGLALVQRIVHEDLGGRIEVESTVGVGSKFTVTLPRTGASMRSGPWTDLARTV